MRVDPGSKNLSRSVKMTTLADLLDSLSCLTGCTGKENVLDKQVEFITCDSRKACPGSLFVALKGAEADGHAYVVQAVLNGCMAVVVEQEINNNLGADVCVVRVFDSHLALGELAAAWCGYPAREMTLIGLTGTNGKTTITWLIEQMLLAAGYQAGVIGTVNYRYIDEQGDQVVEDALLTTPDPVSLQQLLRRMAVHGVTHVVMEASSHALVQKRLAGMRFNLALFTNLSRDHLDFHETMERYFAAKKLLFTEYLADDGISVIVTEPSEQQRENRGQELVRNLAGKQVVSCGFNVDCDVTAEDWQQDMDGFSCRVVIGNKQCRLHSSLTGRYNVLNMLAAAGAGHALGLETDMICRALSQVRRIPGRLERVELPGQYKENGLPAVFVDYAHTPDALENVLQTLQQVIPGRLLCVFGCGGDRDRGKRSIMGQVAGRLADVVIVTSDNPRTEDPQTIIAGIKPGVLKSGMKEYLVDQLFLKKKPEQGFISITDRRSAIHIACSLAKDTDTVLIAGKGHEDYQIVGTERLFLDDRIEAMNGLLCWNRQHLLKATGGRVVSGNVSGVFGAVSTDTRALSPGDIFVALCGDTFDGHDYVTAASENGAAVIIIHREVESLPDETLVIRVDDTLQALGDLAGYRRRLLAPQLKMAAITGSSGKTTVKEMTAAVFSEHLQSIKTGIDPVLKTKGNFNNLIGLPLSLLPAEAGHRMAVLEMGMNRPGEIERLTHIADPDIGCITNVQTAHLEGLGSIEGVAGAKGELFAAMREDAIRVVNFDDPLVRKLIKKNSVQIIGFAVTSAGRRHKPDVRATRIQALGEQGMRFTLHIGEWRQRFTMPAPGYHSVANSVAAAAIAHAAEIKPDPIIRGLLNYRAVDKRMQFDSLPGRVRVVNDSYNANPASMAAAIKTVATFGTDCTKVAVLGDMLELGENAEKEHEKIGKLAAESGYGLLAVTGEYAYAVARAAGKAGMADNAVWVFTNTASMADWLYRLIIAGTLVQGDWILVKGSRGMRMEQVLEEIQHRFDDQVERVN
ncbi:MAG: UDP-N-acetylmuramoyl-L-alanyl-D-glutamate--2,6-diaminopimelate ligase [Desulfobulbaceae bacterium]|nr:UDP-N-acetylmuramoyl-L-alanyl-D-glutamate--2,6-diaminopimelate ligase [Desulfobulbaceae bacterium]